MIWSESMRSLMRSILAGEPLHEIWADACEDEGTEANLIVAERVRIGCELEPNPNHCTADCCTLGFGPCRWCKLRSRQHEIFEWFCREDMAVCFGMPPHETMLPTSSGIIFPGPGVEMKFRRGFPWRLTCSWETWRANHRAWYWYSRPCKKCDGKGEVYHFAGPSSEWDTCSTCHGSGKVEPTDECGKCEGCGFRHDGAGGNRAPCPTCRSSGRIPRPCPVETAMPLECVRLTTRPNIDWVDSSLAMAINRDTGFVCDTSDFPDGVIFIPAALAAEWPGLRFEFVGADRGAGDDRTVYQLAPDAAPASR